MSWSRARTATGLRSGACPRRPRSCSPPGGLRSRPRWPGWRRSTASGTAANRPAGRCGPWPRRPRWRRARPRAGAARTGAGSLPGPPGMSWTSGRRAPRSGSWARCPGCTKRSARLLGPRAWTLRPSWTGPPGRALSGARSPRPSATPRRLPARPCCGRCTWPCRPWRQGWTRRPWPRSWRTRRWPPRGPGAGTGAGRGGRVRAGHAGQ